MALAGQNTQLDRARSETDASSEPSTLIKAWLHLRDVKKNSASSASVNEMLIIFHCPVTLFSLLRATDTSPRKANEAMFELHSGNFVNRWYDKSVQLVVFGNGVAGFVNNYLAGMTGTVGTNFVRIAVKNERLAGEETEDGGLRCDINFTETCSAPLKFSTESFCHITFVFISVLRNRQTSCRSFIYTWKNKGYYH